MSEINFRINLLQVVIHYNQHLISIISNVEDIELFKKSHGYKKFMSRYGDIIVEYSTEDNYLRHIIKPNCTILLTNYDESSSGLILQNNLNEIFSLLETPSDFSGNIISNIMESYHSREDYMLNHTVQIFNRIFEQEAEVEMEYYSIKQKKGIAFYNNHYYENESNRKNN